MIRVSLPHSPPHYESKVRLPGTAFLASTPRPTADDWRRERHWSHIHSDLYRWHKGVCVYCASWTPRNATRGADHTSVDHFVPKSAMPRLAYEWSNFRLSRAKLNHRKADFQDVLDPLVVQNGWFRLSFTTFRIEAPQGLPQNIQVKVDDTINRLQLNLDQNYVNERARAVYRYSANKLPFAKLERLYPFIASQMVAQDFDRNFRHKIQAVLAKMPWLSQ